MTYGRDRSLPASSDRRARDVQPGFVTWRRLDERSRLELVERELKPANHLIDAYPIAL